MIGKKLIIIFISLLSIGCVHQSPRTILFIGTESLQEILTDISNAEQQTLCQRDNCIQPDNTILATPVEGWSRDKSRAFNQKLVPIKDTGSTFNQLLLTWTPGAPMPQQLRTFISQLGSLVPVLANDFPEGTTKTRILTDFNKAQQFVLQAISIYIDASAQPIITSPILPNSAPSPGSTPVRRP